MPETFNMRRHAPKPLLIYLSLLQGAGRLILLLACFLCLAGAAGARGLNPPPLEFPENLEWLNVSRPLTLSDLKGKVVILDFWTYGCINCIHVLADLHRLEEKYQDKLAVIGVHTPKFDNEKNLSTLASIVIRYHIEHPVIQDNNHELMDYYRLRAWPTQVVIDPEGEIVGAVRGEGNYELFDTAIETLLEEHAGIIDSSPLPISLEKTRLHGSVLAAPGKIALSRTLVAISDTLHHRVVVTDHNGRIRNIYGGLEPGFNDGDNRTARFNSPQGLVFGQAGLYVADTGNHSIRHIDLKYNRVSTIAGNGTNEIIFHGTHPAREIGLRSPWDLALKEPWLYVAMAGMHQIWRLHLERDEISVFAGSAGEGVRDGPIRRATFSQPSGLALAQNLLYVADAEASAVRRIDLESRRVETLIGTGLFDFGDADGPFNKAELQHVLGIAVLDAANILIADTYNHKLKKLDLERERAITLAGNGSPGDTTGPGLSAQLNEPGGVAVWQDLILIADTNNHRIVRYDQETKILSEWPVRSAR